MTTSRELLSREKIIDVINRLPEDATIDDAIYRLKFLKAVAAGLEQAEDGHVIDHDDLFAELLGGHEKNSSALERPGKPGSAAIKSTDRKKRAKGRTGVRAKVKGNGR